jgi:4-aminobutyrate aminotransferase
MGERLKSGLKEQIGKKGIIDVRGIGLMIGIEYDTKENRDDALKEAFRHGLLLLPAGQKAMRAIPPLIIAEEEVDEGIEIMASL